MLTSVINEALGWVPLEVGGWLWLGRIWRQVGTVGVVAVLALGLAACNRGTSSNTTGGGGGGGGSSGGKIAAVIKGLDNPFFQAMQQGIEEQASAQGTEVTVQAATT